MFTLELTACGDTPPEYITASVSFSEPYGESYETGRAWETEQDGITYYFANQISEEDRNAVVAETKKLVWAAEERFGMSHVVHAVCMREDNYLPRGDMLNSGYENLRTLASDYYKQSCYMERILGKYDSNIEEKAIVRFVGPQEWGMYAGVYGGGEIQMSCCMAFMHEYIHYMLRDTPVETWRNEVVAYYYFLCPYDDHITYGAYSEKLRWNLLDSNDPKDAREIILENQARGRLDHKFNFDSPEDVAFGMHVDALLFDQLDSLQIIDGGRGIWLGA